MMQSRSSTHTTPLPVEHDEMILVVKRDDLFPQGAWSGLKQVNLDQYVDLISRHKEFMPRSHMETDPVYKQIIPYLVYMHDNRYFLMQRKAKITEQRLQNKYSLGIGGHIRQEDMHSHAIIEWAKREFHEEIHCDGTFDVQFLGILNDDSTSEGQVHVGVVFLLVGTSPLIQIRSEHKSGALLPLTEIEDFYPRMETWSQIVYTYLKNNAK